MGQIIKTTHKKHASSIFIFRTENEKLRKIQTDCILLPSPSKKGVQSGWTRPNGYPKNYRDVSHEHIQHI